MLLEGALEPLLMSRTLSSLSPSFAGLSRFVPAMGWLRSYNRNWLRPDAIAGLTLAAYMLPAGIGDASLASLPAQAGIYACLFSGLVFWLFCSSRHSAITVSSAISLPLGFFLGRISAGGPSALCALGASTRV